MKRTGWGQSRVTSVYEYYLDMYQRNSILIFHVCFRDLLHFLWHAFNVARVECLLDLPCRWVCPLCFNIFRRNLDGTFSLWIHQAIKTRMRVTTCEVFDVRSPGIWCHWGPAYILVSILRILGASNSIFCGLAGEILPARQTQLVNFQAPMCALLSCLRLWASSTTTIESA